MSVRMTREEAWAVLASAHTGILTTLRSDGAPISLPVWFVVLDERVYVRGPSSAKRHRRVERDERVAFLVESGERWAELAAVHMSGRAHIVEDADVVARVAVALDEKYARYRTAREEMPDATRRHYEVALTTIEIVPDARILSWDNTRISGATP